MTRSRILPEFCFRPRASVFLRECASGIWLAKQDGHRADNWPKHVEVCRETPSYGTIEIKLRPLTRSVSGDGCAGSTATGSRQWLADCQSKPKLMAVSLSTQEQRETNVRSGRKTTEFQPGTSHCRAPVDNGAEDLGARESGRCTTSRSGIRLPSICFQSPDVFTAAPVALKYIGLAVLSLDAEVIGGRVVPLVTHLPNFQTAVPQVKPQRPLVGLVSRIRLNAYSHMRASKSGCICPQLSESTHTTTTLFLFLLIAQEKRGLLRAP
jgi:hypothetical protein